MTAQKALIEFTLEKMETNTPCVIFLVEAANVVRRVVLEEVAIRVSPLDNDG